MKKSLAAGVLLLASSQAFAGIITHTEIASFGVKGSVIDKKIGFGLNEVLTINAFNTALGRLTGVSIDVFSQIDTAGRSTNTSEQWGESQFNFDITNDFTVSSDVGNHTFTAAGNLFTDFDGDHDVDEVFDYGHLTSYKTGSFNPTDFSAFTSDVSFTFATNVSAAFINVTDAGSAVFKNSIDSAAWGKVAVTYTYDDTPHGPVPVPAPTSLAMLGLGLAGFAFSRRNKKSA